MAHDQPEMQTNVLAAGLKGRCPRCGEGALFKGGLTLRDNASAAGSTTASRIRATGPPCSPSSSWGSWCSAPPCWSSSDLSRRSGCTSWPGVADPLVGFLLLRLLKATLIAQQYKHKAAEGRLTSE